MALLIFAKDLGWVDYRDICDASNVILMIPFFKRMQVHVGCVVRLSDGVHPLCIKGASDIL